MRIKYNYIIQMIAIVAAFAFLKHGKLLITLLGIWAVIFNLAQVWACTGEENPKMAEANYSDARGVSEWLPYRLKDPSNLYLRPPASRYRSPIPKHRIILQDAPNRTLLLSISTLPAIVALLRIIRMISLHIRVILLEITPTFILLARLTLYQYRGILCREGARPLSWAEGGGFEGVKIAEAISWSQSESQRG